MIHYLHPFMTCCVTPLSSVSRVETLLDAAYNDGTLEVTVEIESTEGGSFEVNASLFDGPEGREVVKATKSAQAER
jgi:hypothetical protein